MGKLIRKKRLRALEIEVAPGKAELTRFHLAVCKFDTFVLQFVLHFDKARKNFLVAYILQENWK